MFELFGPFLYIAAIALCFYYFRKGVLSYGEGKKLNFDMWCLLIIASIHTPIAVTNLIGDALTFVNGVLL